MTNAGRTRSFGIELSANWQPVEDLRVSASYGYTNATFLKYNDGKQNYKGKHLPYAPENTLFGEISWRATPLEFLGVTPSLSATARCAGRIFWDDANTVSQPFYCLPGLTIGFNAEKWNLTLWGTNLSNTRYDVFYFLSMGNAFVQHGFPRRFGATIRFRI